MPQSETLDAAVSRVRRARLVDDARLATYLADLPADLPSHDLFPRLAAAGLLTTFQATELAAGREHLLHFGPYRVLDRLGRGGMGRVYRCEHEVMGRVAAVKVLADELRADIDARRRFAREARAAAAVDHPNVVRVFDLEAGADPPFLVMEFVDGVSWQAAVARHGPFAPAEAAACGVQAARGLQALAVAGLVHRDVKPANLLVDRAGVVKVLDFGIARVSGEASITLDGGASVLGTLDYLAPEQAVDGSAVDERADLYALGASLFFLLSGRPPFPDGVVEEKVGRKLTGGPAAVAGLPADVPAGLADVVGRLLAAAPSDRYPTAAAAAAALKPWAAGLPDEFPTRLFAPAVRRPTVPGPPTGALDAAPVTAVCPTIRVVRPGAKGMARPTDPHRVDFDAPHTPQPVSVVPATGPTERVATVPRLVLPHGQGRVGVVAAVVVAAVLAVLVWLAFV